MPKRGGAHYCRRMHVVRRLLWLGALSLVLLGVGGAALAAASPDLEAIYRDYTDDRVLDGDYRAGDLEAAIRAAEGDVFFSDFAAAVQDVLDREILGLSTSDERGAPVAGADPSSPLLPRPRAPGERDQPPWPFIALTALAAALVLTGAGSSLLRRARR